MLLIGMQGEIPNDCFTLCEMVHNVYRTAVKYSILVSGFSAYGIWALRGGGVDMSLISEADMITRGTDETAKEAYTR